MLVIKEMYLILFIYLFLVVFFGGGGSFAALFNSVQWRDETPAPTGTSFRHKGLTQNIVIMFTLVFQHVLLSPYSIHIFFTLLLPLFYNTAITNGTFSSPT